MLTLTLNLARTQPATKAAQPSGLGWSELNSRDGFTREAAVTRLGTNWNAAQLIAVLTRCNDWVPQVQRAAKQRLEAETPYLSKHVLAGAMPFLLTRVPLFGRGGDQVLTRLQELPNWPRALRYCFLTQTNGPLVRALREALKDRSAEEMLPELALDAKSSFVRAEATRAVLEKTIRVDRQKNWRWLDKRYGLKQSYYTWRTRPYRSTPDLRAQVLRAACQDSAISVRRVAADHLIEIGPLGNAALVKQLRQDTATAVIWRMDYFEKKWGAVAL